MKNKIVTIIQQVFWCFYPLIIWTDFLFKIVSVSYLLDAKRNQITNFYNLLLQVNWLDPLSFRYAYPFSILILFAHVQKDVTIFACE